VIDITVMGIMVRGMSCDEIEWRESGEGHHGRKHMCGRQEVPRDGTERELRGASR
jgi:hypothetical protein